MAVSTRTALVTGAGQGIGEGIARAFAEAGHAVVVSDVNAEAAAAVRDALVAEGFDRVTAHGLDVRERSSFEDVLRDGPIDILVNNAALTEAVEFEDLDPDRWQRLMDVNLRGTLFGCQAVLPGMKERGWGRIVNITSLAGLRGGPAVQGAHYAVSKAGIVGLTRYLAHYVGDTGVTVNAIAPGPVLTPQTAKAPPEKLEAVRKQIPVNRLGATGEVGAAAVYLAGELSGFVTGVVLDVNGGILMR